MSRSIHRTRRDVDELTRTSYSQPKEKKRQLREIARQLTAKRLIKRRVWLERHAEPLPPRPIGPEAIPVLEVDASTAIHYPATVEDLCAVLAALPPGVLDGLARVEMCLGAEFQRDHLARDPDDDYQPDPWVGRLSRELVPGVFNGPVLGHYTGDGNVIRLFAYVGQPEAISAKPVALFLKLRMLATLVHEVAHHDDQMRRQGRGRWLGTNRERAEMYAEQWEHAWVQQHVVSYLEQAYPEATRELSSWIEHHGGVAVPLVLLAGDPRTTHPGGLTKLVWTLNGAFQALVEEVEAGNSLTDTRLSFAWEVDFAERFDLVNAILDRVLTEEPGHLKALTMRAHVFVHLEEFSQAQALARRVLAQDPSLLDAWKELASASKELKDWPTMLEAANEGVARCEPGSNEFFSWLVERARALLELGQFEALRVDVEALLGSGSLFRRATAHGFLAISLLRQQLFEEALVAADTGLAIAKGTVWDIELLAVRAEALLVLGRFTEDAKLAPYKLERLKRKGYEPWIDRLLGTYPGIVRA